MNLLPVRYLQIPAWDGVIAASLYLVSRREFSASKAICDALHRRIKPRISLPSHLYMGANIRNCLNCVTQFTQWNHLGSWLRYEP